MAMGSFNGTGSQMPTAEINMTPLVDVMLVLLIIFMITAPLMTHSVKVDLPRASSTPTPEKPMTLQVAITADNKVFIGSEPVDAATLETRFRDAVGQDDAIDAGECVVGEDRRQRDGEAGGSHDQGFANRTGDLLQRRLAGHADGDQCVVDAPDGTEQADERRGGAGRGEEGQTVFHAGLSRRQLLTQRPFHLF